MDGQVNRAKQLWENWEHQQKQMESLAGGTDDRNALKYKYDFLSKGLYRLSVNPSEKERLFLQAISLVRAKLQKQLYLNPLIRLLKRLKTLIVDKPAHLELFRKNKDQNLEWLKEQLKTIGLHHFVGKLENSLDYESPAIELASWSGLNDNSKLEVRIHLERNNYGSYHFNGYTASLIAENGEKRTCDFKLENRIRIAEAVNLLQGRPVYKNHENADGSITQRWFQLEQRDQENNTNLGLLLFSPTYDFELKKVLLDQAVQLEFYGIAREAVQRGLEAGNNVALEIPGKGKFFIAVNPSQRTVQFFDTDKKPVRIDSLKNPIKPLKQDKQKDLKLVKRKDLQQENQIQIIR